MPLLKLENSAQEKAKSLINFIKLENKEVATSTVKEVIPLLWHQ